MAEQRKKAGGRGKGFGAQMSDEPSSTMAKSKHSNLADLVRMEMKKYMKEEIPLHPLKINYAQLDNFAGSSAISAFGLSNSWIIDSGATHHICADFKLFHSYTKLTNPMIIHLPHGHSQSVSHIGSLHLCSRIELTQVLHIPSFSDQKTNRVLATAHLIRNLYILESVSIPTKSGSPTYTPYSCIADLNQSDLWHQRLGHLSHNSIKHIGDLSQLNHTLKPCDICPLAKMCKLPFESSKMRTKYVFSLIHLDIWGPYREPTTSGIFFEILGLFINLAVLILQNKMESWSVPIAVLNWKTPYEVLYDKPPTYSHLRTIGYLCFAIKPEPHVSKFDKRASRCVFFGYPSGEKAYRRYDLETKSTFVSRNVQFRENCFPFASVQASTQRIPLAVIPLTDDDLEDSTSIPRTSSSPSFSIPPDQYSFSPSPAILRSMRSHNKPAWLNDFICHLPSLDQSPVITSYDPAYMGFVSSLSILQEPRTYRAAASIPHWTEAMRWEIAALEQNHTWEIEGVDYTERFSPVAKSVTVRLFFDLTTAFQWPLHQVDINNAFLHGYLGNLHLISQVKVYLYGLFSIKDLGCARYFLGLQIARSAADIIRDCGLQSAKPVATRLPSGIKLHSASVAPLADPERYRRLVGRLLYLCFT
ncbi:uncharacterized protein LOC105172310 [Sesamum indicum]|uniref:Uncharacterized protein LOC105172310 n=1 Tax=Sesamum indicum TaxID=4182 RepID=A0A6I9TXI4_SESIN|nr:uncharacterized protein LOC105172310 [Sesamum indicum]